MRNFLGGLGDDLLDRGRGRSLGSVTMMRARSGRRKEHPASGDGALSAIIKDWALNGTFAAMVGTPFRVTSSGASVNAPGNTQSADRVGTRVVLGQSTRATTRD